MVFAQHLSHSGKVIHFYMNKDLTKAGVLELVDHLEVLSERAGSTIYLLGEFDDFLGFCSFRAFWKTEKNHFASLGNLKKFAIVAEKKWVCRTGSITDFFAPGIDLQVFDRQELQKAFSWLAVKTEEKETRSQEMF